MTTLAERLDDDEGRLMRRLYNASQRGRGVSLSAEDLIQLLQDDAVCTRITNAACRAAGVAEYGCDSATGSPAEWSWADFVGFIKQDERP